MNLFPLRIVDCDCETYVVFASKGPQFLRRPLPSELPEDAQLSMARAIGHQLRDSGWIVRIGRPSTS